MRKEGALSLRGYNSLLFDFAEYYLRLFRAVVAVVAGCWLVIRGICTGGLSEDGCDVRPKAAKRVLGVVTCRATGAITSDSQVMTVHINAISHVRNSINLFGTLSSSSHVLEQLCQCSIPRESHVKASSIELFIPYDLSVLTRYINVVSHVKVSVHHQSLQRHSFTQTSLKSTQPFFSSCRSM